MTDHLTNCHKCGDFVYLSDREITASMTEDEQQLLLNDLYRAHDGDPSPIYCAMCCDTDKGRFHRASAMDRAVRRWKLNGNDNNRSIQNDAGKLLRQAGA